MKAKPDFLKNSVVIGAHADDEILWFNSIARDADKLIVVYRDFWARPEIGAKRAAALAEYPHANVECLDINESGAYGCADWQSPVLTEHGIAFGFEANRREIARLARMSLSRVSALERVHIATESVANTYQANFYAIYEALKSRIRPEMNVFTHNPWGEYGHEEHIQVFRVLQRLRDEIGFKLWMSNYCTDRAMPLAMRYFQSCPGDYVRLPTDKAFAEAVADVYKKHDCWTWADDWTWFDEECFMEAPGSDSDAAPHRHLFPLNFFTIDGTRSNKWMPLALTMTVTSAAIGVTLSEAI